MDLNLQETDFTTLVQKVLDRQEFAANQKGVDISLSKPEQVPVCLLDGSRMEQVISNLLDNAIKFSFKGSVIEVFYQYDDETILFSVRDHGPGIPEKEQSRLFKAFSTTSVKPTGSERSTGLGLAIARNIIEKHHGKIWVESEQGNGSTFSFSLPVNPPGD
jgi:signal transduction histidine kinase